ncbi:MAG: hypothetical protein H6Q31_636 [Bacteroidetes bacterium]|jgi:hypothetical protein|nr:hypothetical protein [Bacteroidota bacterium]
MISEDSRNLIAGEVLSFNARLGRVGLGLALAAAVGTTLFLQPVGAFLPACLFHELTGVSCLTCGLTRSLEAAAHGDVLGAMHFHLLGPFIMAGMLIACMVCAAEAVAGRRIVQLRQARWQPRMLLVVAGIWVVYGVARAIVELL